MTRTPHKGHAVVTTRDTASFDDDGVVVPAGTAGEVIGDGFDVPPTGEQFVGVDFGNVVADVRVADLAAAEHGVCPDCGGRTFWSVEASDWLHEASDSQCFLASAADLAPAQRTNARGLGEWVVTIRGFGHVSTQRYYAASQADAERQALDAAGITIGSTRQYDAMHPDYPHKGDDAAG